MQVSLDLLELNGARSMLALVSTQGRYLVRQISGHHLIRCGQ